MKSAVIFLFLNLFAACAVNTVESQKRTDNPPSPIPLPVKQAVLVELFTSEGCSSCPPADRALAFLEKEQPYPQADVVTLALHVDYWNNLGWKDEFSSPLFTQRQEYYAQKLKLDSAYTPQMIVDGKLEFVGSDLGKAAQTIAEAAKTQKGKIEIARGNDNLTLRITDLPNHEAANVFLAITEDNLVSRVGRGENSGKTLEHNSVVRELKSIGTLTAQQKSAEIETPLAFSQNWKKENLKIVVFVQENESRKVLVVGKINLENN
ncbi:MAG TPA: DUF1223 domain-containing protein [Pyrinomonadaceae bacterium]|jgi:hypothetical protein